MERLMRVYCASPYTSTDPRQVAQNILRAEQVGVEVRALGHVPFVPHIALPAFPPSMPIEAQWGPAMKECISHLESCDALLLTGDWTHSRGCRAEAAHAYGMKIPVFFGLDEIGVAA
jgi:hypothetical protein